MLFLWIPSYQNNNFVSLYRYSTVLYKFYCYKILLFVSLISLVGHHHPAFFRRQALNLP